VLIDCFGKKKEFNEMEDFQSVHGGEDISNSYLATIYANGEMNECEDGVHFQGPTPTLL